MLCRRGALLWSGAVLVSHAALLFVVFEHPWAWEVPGGRGASAAQEQVSGCLAERAPWAARSADLAFVS